MKKVILTGTFDFFHPGHIDAIRQAKELGDFLIVIIARDKNVEKHKGFKPHFNEEERLSYLKILKIVDKVILGDLKDPYKIIREEEPDVVALGYDQQFFVKGLYDLRLNSKLHYKIEELMPFKEDYCKGRKLRKAHLDEQAGFLLIDKEDEWTSHDVVSKLRSILDLKQIGHTGTLDPFATGLLICAVSKATKLVGIFDLLPKEYEATIKLGGISDTYDRTGTISKEKEVDISKEKLEKVLNKFIGKQKQTPPMYSAKKVNGKKLYDLARQGKVIKRKKSSIEIYNIELIEFKNDLLKIRVKCSTGTYIRTLAHDIGKKLKTGAYIEELKRIAIGDFKSSN